MSTLADGENASAVGWGCVRKGQFQENLRIAVQRGLLGADCRWRETAYKPWPASFWPPVCPSITRSVTARSAKRSLRLAFWGDGVLGVGDHGRHGWGCRPAAVARLARCCFCSEGVPPAAIDAMPNEVESRYRCSGPVINASPRSRKPTRAGTFALDRETAANAGPPRPPWLRCRRRYRSRP
jgi:hypothetical protein